MEKIEALHNETLVNEVATNQVSEQFVNELKSAFLCNPKYANMSCKQKENKLFISVSFVFKTKSRQRIEGFGDTDLISAIHMAMENDFNGLHDYNAAEHEVVVAEENENLVLELFKQYMNSSLSSNIDTDWLDEKGNRYRRVFFSPSFNKNVKFCLKATEEINQLIEDARNPEPMIQAEAERKAKQETEA